MALRLGQKNYTFSSLDFQELKVKFFVPNLMSYSPYLTPSQYQYWASLIASLGISTDSEL